MSHLTSWREVIFLKMLLQICRRFFIQILYVLLLFDKEFKFFNLFFCIIIVQVTNYEDKDEREYGTAPRTDYQRFIRLKKQGALTFFILLLLYTPVYRIDRVLTYVSNTHSQAPSFSRTRRVNEFLDTTSKLLVPFPLRKLQLRLRQ